MGYQQKIWWIGLHIAVPLIMGAVIYYLISPEVIFIKMFSTHGGIPTPLKLNQSHVIYRFIRNYFLDMLDLCQYLGHKKLNFFSLPNRQGDIVLSSKSLILNLLWCLVSKGTVTPFSVVK